MSQMPVPEPGPLIGPGDPPAAETIHADGRAAAVLICDHASRAVPQLLDGLGLSEDELGRHIAWDIGAAAVVRGLSARLDAPAVLAGYSRLVIDLNRTPGDPTSIPALSDGTPIPANQGLSEEAVEARQETFFWPYHHAVTETIGRQWRHTGRPPVLIAVHSFTPEMNGSRRPWDIGVLWNHDPRMAVPLMRRLEARGDLAVGDNVPYSGREIAYTTERHAAAAGLAHVGLEIRQDLIADAAGMACWVEILADAFAALLADGALHRVEMF